MRLFTKPMYQLHIKQLHHIQRQSIIFYKIHKICYRLHSKLLNPKRMRYHYLQHHALGQTHCLYTRRNHRHPNHIFINQIFRIH